MKIITSQELEGETLGQIMNRGKIDLSLVSSGVQEVINAVKEEGDKALLHYTEKFDNTRLTRLKLKVTEKEIEESYGKLKRHVVNALKKAAMNIARFHKRQIKERWSLRVVEGVTVGQVTRPLSSVGIYAPGGKASYSSSVLMCTIPAKVAGVEKIVICSPPGSNGDIHPAVIVAADVAGATDVYRIGGAQAIAAMAYGTETIPKVDKIVGPGNIFVTAAKLQVSKDVAVDLPAGPSEVLIIADETANPSFIASDLLAQAEHDPQACTILLTTSKNLALAVREEVITQLESLSRRDIARISVQTRGLIMVVKDIEEAIKYANMIAPEHLEILTNIPHEIFDKIQNAGAVFLGEYSPVAFGDYSAGINHVLPTGGYAKTYSGLSTRDFVKTINFVHCNKQGYLNLKKTTTMIAKLEGLDGHEKSISIREEQT